MIYWKLILMELEKVLHVVTNELKNFYYQPNLRHVDDQELEDFATNCGIRTQHGSLAFSSNVRSSSLPLTVYVGGKEVTQKNLNPSQIQILKNLPSTLVKVHHYAKKVPFVCVEKRMCNNEGFNFHCTLFTSLYKKDSIKLPFLWGQSLFNLSQKRGLKLHLVCIPEWPAEQRQTIVFPEIGVTYVLGTDYFDEIRKCFLRMAMWFAKTNGVLALYAGGKLVTCFDEIDKRIKNYGALFIGSPGTGKTTHLADNLGLNRKGERVKVVQDGVVLIRKYSQILGTEKVFLVKTEGLDSHLQPLLWRAVLNRKTNFENVIVDHQGRLDFQDSTLTNNGRALVQVQDLGQTNEDINLPSIEELDGLKIFIMAKLNTVVPPICKLEPHQAVALFMLGESIDDKEKEEQIVRTPACNPYLVGSAEEEAQGLLNFIENNRGKIELYLLNTGSIGESQRGEFIKKRKSRPKTIEIQEFPIIEKAIFKGNISWEESRYWEVFVPKAIENGNLDKYKLENFYSPDDIKKSVSKLRIERQKYLKNFSKLPTAVKKAVI
jgi:phosphoenolpyruvate carboxykinase (ATP)